MSIIFKNKEHEINYNFILDNMKCKYKYGREYSLAYLFALDEQCFEHLHDLFDFFDHNIIIEGWDYIGGNGQKTVRLAFNLWNGFCSDGGKYIEDDGFESDLPSKYFSPCNIFNCQNGIYYFEAIKLRFPKYYQS